MKLTTGILIMGMVAGTAWAQNPDVIENTRNTLKAIEQKKAIDSNAALAASQGQTAKPSAPVAAPVAATAKPAPSKPGVDSVAATKGAAPKPAPKANQKPAQTATQKPAPAVHVAAAPKPAAKQGAAKAQIKTVAAKAKSKTVAAKAKAVAAKAKAVAAKPAQPKQQLAVEEKKNPMDAKKDQPKPINLTGRRDPFISPVVNRAMVGSGCSTGKKCLAIDQISLKGVVKAEAGMIAVVVNAMNKAYFLRENDPVFNGYVVRITGDSIIFKETTQDRLGKSFTREVTKTITTPAV